MPDPCSPEIAAGSVSKIRKQNKRNYACDICGTKLSRISHLHRHQLQHSSSKEIFQCHTCNKTFNRKDVYQRHVRVVHDPRQAGQKKRSKKSCERCIRYKLKCNRDLPCASCLRKHVSCTYETTSSGLAIQPQPQSLALPQLPWDADNDERDSIRHDQPSPGYESTGSYLEGEFPESSGSLARIRDTVNTPTLRNYSANSLKQPRPDFLHANLPQQPAAMDPQDYTPAPFLPRDSPYSALQINQELLGSTADVENYEWLDHLSLDLEAFDSSFFRASKMDWLGCETDVSPPVSGDMQIFCNDEPFNRDGLVPQPISIDQPFTPILGAEQPQLNPDNSDKNEHESWPGILDRGGNESWPFDYTSNKGFRKIQLPPLREVLEQTMGNIPTTKSGTAKDLVKVLSNPFIPSLNDSAGLEVLPTITFLGELVKTYFAEFHPAFSIVHLPTWRIEKCPAALVAAMACIGASYSTAEGTQRVAPILAEITQRSLFWMGQSDSRSYRNPVYIAASCLHQIYALGSGNRRLYELADASRGLLATGLRELGVLSSDAAQSDNISCDFQHLKRMDPSTLERAWNCWRDTEFERRVAWSVFEFDCTMSTLTSKRGVFGVSELPMKAPCSENLWEAPSANAWASVASFSTSLQSDIPFYPLLQNIIAQREIPNTTPTWAKRICSLVISRLLGDLREIEDISSSKVLGLSSLVDVHKKTRENLLVSLSGMSNSLSRPTCVNEMVNINVACSTAHYAYLSSGGETMDLVTFIFRHNYAWKHGSSAAQLNKELSRARSHLRLRFARNPVATRRSVHHAALVVAISRDCTSFTPCETMRVFFSFAFLLAFVKFFPFDEGPVAAHGTSTIRLDESPLEQIQTRDDPGKVEKWIEHGGPASLGSVDNICDAHSLGTLREDALRAMDHLRVWGLAKKFHRVLQSFNND